MNLIDTQYIPKPDTVADFGCDTKEQLHTWRSEICGVCCLKMIGDTKSCTVDLSLWQLTMDCLRQGAFIKNNTGQIDGIFHRPMVKVARGLGLHACVLPKLPLSFLKFLLAVRFTPILSIDLHKLNPKYEAGHLVVVVGYDRKNRTYIVHDPSSVLAIPGKSARVSFEMLKQVSNNRGVVLF
jgi:hypothetical protein